MRRALHSATSRQVQPRNAVLDGLRPYTLWFVLLGLIAAMSLVSPKFLTLENFFSVFRNVTYVAMISFGLTFVFLAGGFDLSQGAVLILSAMIINSFNPQTPQAFAAIVALVIVVAGLVGSLNGFLCGVLQLNSFVVTLATRYIVGGVGFMYAAGAVVGGAAQGPLMEAIGLNRLFNLVPITTVVWVMVGLLCWFVIQYSPYARKITVVGSSWRTARYSGLRVERLQMSTYMINSVLAGAAGILVACQTSFIAPTLVWFYDFDAITACALGGISLSGGKGSIVNALCGVLLLGFINNSMVLLGIPSSLQSVLKGMILMAAIIIDIQGKRRRE
jgi:ribose transport system permease protein